MSRAILQVILLLSFIIMGGDLARTAAQQSTAGDHLWEKYTNVRFRYTICYPKDLLVPQGESADSDGQKFLAKDGAQLVVFGQNNALDESLKDMLAHAKTRLAGTSGHVTYQVLRPSWFVVSGQNGRKVFYVKALYNRDQFKSFELTYNHSGAPVYEPLIGQLVACFADLAR